MLTAPPPVPPAPTRPPAKPPAPKPAPKPEPKKDPEPPKEKPTMKTIDYLRQELANGMVFWANAKGAHWSACGPTFRDLHGLFEDFATASYDTLDSLAERLRMLSQDVGLVTLKDFQDKATITSSKPGMSMRALVEEAKANADIIIGEMRAAAEQADEECDAGDVDVFSKFVQAYEKISWFCRQTLEKDGL